MTSRWVVNASPLILLGNAGYEGLFAKVFGIPLLGTLGVVLLAKQRGIIPTAREVLERLQANGFRMDRLFSPSAGAVFGWGALGGQAPMWPATARQAGLNSRSSGGRR